MIFVTHQLPVNVDGEPHLDRAAVWDGLVLKGVEGGSAEEQEYADSMTGDYLKAVAATLNAMRQIAVNA